ncbi:MAG: hypothetical protein FVQ84_22880 [Planctomycetes bacterium]|nr:hypothetical protein [Planctomycetota bacterium]
MAKRMGKSDKGSDAATNKVVIDFVSNLDDEDRMLVVLKAHLYGGTWEPMLDDLENRLLSKPYIFKLAKRIKDDIERIQKMQEFEAKNNIDLAEYVELDNEPYLKASASKLKAKGRTVGIEETTQRQKLLLCTYVDEINEDDDVVDGVVDLYCALNKYHILCGGRGLAIDDWQMFIRQTDLVEVGQ